MTLREWEKLREEAIADMTVFEVMRTFARSPRTGAERPFARILCRDWINVVAITPEREVVMVKQYRHGSEEFTLEIPGGVTEPGEDPQVSAVRELREETGHTDGEVSRLGSVRPNPALLNNRCHSFLVEGCSRTQDLELDPGEDIEVSTVPLAELPTLTRDGTIDHALVLNAFWWLSLRRPDLLSL